MFASGQGLSGVYVGITAEYVDVLVDVAVLDDALNEAFQYVRLDAICS